MPEQKWLPSADRTTARTEPDADISSTMAREVVPERGDHRVCLLRAVHLDVTNLVGNFDVKALVSHALSLAERRRQLQIVRLTSLD